MADHERQIPTTADLDAKRRTIETFFADFEERVAFAYRLYRDGRRREAFILICAYLEAMGTYHYDPTEGSKRNFAKVLIEHGGDPNLALVHPRLLLESIRGKSAELAAVAAKVDAKLLRKPFELRSPADTMDFVDVDLTSTERGLLQDSLWLGSLAAVAYREFRIPSSHRGAAPNAIEFEYSQFAGGPAPTIDFTMLHAALDRIVATLKTLSVSTNTWFGHD